MAVEMRSETEEAPPQETVTDWATGEILGVLPFASQFPRLAADEFADLVADIQAHGLRHPVVLADDRTLVDGRNRMDACAAAEIPPHYLLLPPGTDLIAYVLSVNVLRRHMSEGQRAMAVALSLPMERDENNQIGYFQRGVQRDAVQSTGVPQNRMREAMLIRQWAPDLVTGILAGSEPLSGSLVKACARRDEALKRIADMERLRTTAADLATLVEEGRLKLEDAIAALDKREAEARTQEQEAERRELERRMATTQLLVKATVGIAPEAAEIDAWASNVAGLIDYSMVPAGVELTPDRFRHVGAGLIRLAECLEERKNGEAKGT